MMPRSGHPATAPSQVASDGYRQSGRVPSRTAEPAREPVGAEVVLVLCGAVRHRTSREKPIERPVAAHVSPSSWDHVHQGRRTLRGEGVKQFALTR